MNALILLAAVASAPPQAPPLEQRVEALEREVAEIKRRLPQAPPVRLVASPAVALTTQPEIVRATYAAPVCSNGQCGTSRQSYSYQQSSGSGWYPGKRLGR